MRFLILVALIGLNLQAADPVFDSNRKFLKRLKDIDRVSDDKDPLPYLVVTSAQAFKQNQETVYKSIKALLQKEKSRFRGRFSNEGEDFKKKEDVVLPEISVTGLELQGIKECTKSYCAIKLLNGTEKNRIEAATDKVGMFQQFLFERLVAYTKNGEIRGSEDVQSNLETLQKGYATLEFFPKRYPKTAEWINNSVFSRTKGPNAPPFKDSFLRIENIHLDGEKMKPVLRIGEVMEFEEEGTNLFFDLHLYTNHFFDSSLRMIEVAKYPDPKRPSIVLVTDVMEVDELKKSGLIRSLFKGKMSGGIQFYQSVVLDNLEKLLK